MTDRLTPIRDDETLQEWARRVYGKQTTAYGAFEISPREREDEAEQHERDFGVREFQEDDERDRAARSGDYGSDDGWIYE